MLTASIHVVPPNVAQGTFSLTLHSSPPIL
jgi:hypothetical protein